MQVLRLIIIIIVSALKAEKEAPITWIGGKKMHYSS
jgi:hypothetical protein